VRVESMKSPSPFSSPQRGEEIRRCALLKFKSLRVVFPAACGEFVIPAEAGIQKTGLDSASSAE